MLMNWKPLRTGLTVGVILWTIIGLLWVGLSHGAEGLPDAGIPDLYDPAIISTFHLAKRAPYGSCTSTILTSSMAYSQSENGQRAPAAYVLGYLTEPKGRIVVIVQTWIYPSGLRSVRAFYDVDWAEGRPPKGEWGFLGKGISHQMTRAQVREYLQPLMGKIATRMGAGK